MHHLWKPLQPFKLFKPFKSFIRLLAVLVLLLCWPGLSAAFVAVCGNNTDTADPGAGLQFWQFQVDANYPDTHPTCCLVSKTDTPAQRTLLATPGFDPRQYRVQTSPACQAVSKGQTALDAIVAADAAADAEAAELATEFTTNEACAATSLADALTKINTQKTAIQNDIDAVSNIATAKTALTTANNRLTAIDANIVRCLVVLIKRGSLR